MKELDTAGLLEKVENGVWWISAKAIFGVSDQKELQRELAEIEKKVDYKHEDYYFSTTGSDILECLLSKTPLFGRMSAGLDFVDDVFLKLPLAYRVALALQKKKREACSTPRLATPLVIKEREELDKINMVVTSLAVLQAAQNIVNKGE